MQHEGEYSKLYITLKDSPYLTLTYELWGVICKDFGQNNWKIISIGGWAKIIEKYLALVA